MTRVITYGTFDLFHEGHRRILERARAYGDYLIVGVTSEAYDESRGKLHVTQSLVERIDNVKRSGLADLIIVEEYEGQKIRDFERYDVDTFVIGSDWVGKFDHLRDFVDVVYLERTKGVSSTELRDAASGILTMGVVGAGRIAGRMIAESRYVSGVSFESVCSRDLTSAQEFAARYELGQAFADFDAMLDAVDAVYVASPHGTHYEYAARAIDAGVHVLCEKPMTLRGDQAEELFERADAAGVTLMEAVKTAFAPGFRRLLSVARFGTIGSIRSVDATFTKLVDAGREHDPVDGGSISELASYPLLAIVKLLGTDPVDVRTTSLVPEGSQVETFSRIDLTYPHAVASARTGIGVKAEGELIIAGTEGYIYVPAPWWLTEYFEVRYEDTRNNRKYFYKFDGDGLRYELAEFAEQVHSGAAEPLHLRRHESIAIARIIEQARRHPDALIG